MLGNVQLLNAELAGSRPLVLAATLGRTRVVDLVCSLERSEPGLVCRLCFDRGENGESVMECARKKVAFGVFGGSAAEKERCAAILRGLTVRAFNFAVRAGLVGLTRGKQYAELFEPFSHTPAEILRGLARFVDRGDCGGDGSGSGGKRAAGAAKAAAQRVTRRIARPVASARGVEGIGGVGGAGSAAGAFLARGQLKSSQSA